MSLYVNRLRYGYGAPTIGASSGIVNNGYYKGKPLYDDDYNPTHDYSLDYFTIESLEDGNTINFNNGLTVTYYYSLDNGVTWTKSRANASWNLNTGDRLILKSETNYFYRMGYGSCKFSSDKNFDLYGNIMSLTYGDNFVGQTVLKANETFKWLFDNCTKLVNTENLILPATTITEQCYNYLFSGCTSLITAPKQLPATTLTRLCYGSMFSGCTLLETAPELPAQILAQSCYGNMFYNCSNLNYIKCMATDISAGGCLRDWVSGVSATGTFVKNSSMSSWPSGASGIPTGWTVQDYVA